MQKLISIILVISLLLSFTVFTANAADDSSSNELQLLQSLGVINGYPDGGLYPYDTLTRAQAAQILLRIDHPEASTLEAYKTGIAFEDTANHWANQAIYYAKIEGTMVGYDETTFGPDDYLTVVQALKILIKKAGPTRIINKATWEQDTLVYAALYGIYPANPDGWITRDEFAKYIVIINGDKIFESYDTALDLVYDEFGTPTWQFFKDGEVLSGSPTYAVASLDCSNINLTGYTTFKKYLADNEIAYPDRTAIIPFYVNGVLQKRATISTIINYSTSPYETLTIYYKNNEIVSAAAIVYDLVKVTNVSRRGIVSYEVIYSSRGASGIIIDQSTTLVDAGVEVDDYLFVAAQPTRKGYQVIAVETTDYYRGTYVSDKYYYNGYKYYGRYITFYNRYNGTVSFEIADYAVYEEVLAKYESGDKIEVIVYQDQAILINNLSRDVYAVDPSPADPTPAEPTPAEPTPAEPTPANGE